MSDKNAPIKIGQMQRGNTRYYHLKSNHIHTESMDMFETRISFAFDNQEIIKYIDEDEKHQNQFMDLLVKLQEGILNIDKNKAIYQMFIFIDVESKNGLPELNPKVHIISKIYKDYENKQFGVEIKPSNLGVPIHANTFEQLPKEVVSQIKQYGDIVKG